MKRLAAIASAAMIAAVCLSGCGETRPAQAGAPIEVQPAPARPAAAAQEPTLIASGPLVVENQVDVCSERAGVVVKTMAEPGTRASKGQVLAMLDDRQISSDLEAAKAKTRAQEADLKNWEAELKVLEVDAERAQKMWDAQLITKEQLDHAKYKLVSDEWSVKNQRELLSNAQATQHSLELEYEKTRVRAPFDGLVARRYVRPGQRVAVGDRIFWVTAVAPLRVKFTLPERFLGQVKPGQGLRVSSAEVQGSEHSAKVIQVSPVVDPSSGTIEVVAELQGPPGDLRPGMNVNIPIQNSR
jgi:membrane fusion protein (multidrug efflux system)